MFDRFKKNEDDEVPEFATKREFNELKKLIDTHQDYLNNIYVFHELKPTHYMELMRSISFELFYFFDYVCKKHDIDYWLDYGTLLGAVRHNNFIPWDDDLDVGMMRSDYFRFIDIIQDEIDESGIIDVVAVFKHDVRNRSHLRFFQIEFRRPEFNGKFIGIDVFPYDYVVDYENVEEKFTEARSNFYQRRIDGMDIRQVVGELYDDLDLSFEKQDHIIAGVEVPRGPGEMYPFKVIETDKLLPFSEVEFGGKTYKAPNDITNHLKQIYGKKFMRIPNTIHDHRRLKRYVKQPNIISMLEESNDMIINVTKNLK